MRENHSRLFFVPVTSSPFIEPQQRKEFLWHNPLIGDETGGGNFGQLQFGSADVCLLAGVSLRQLQWWDERKIVSPRQEGHRRLYSIADVLGMMVIAELRRKGLSLQKIRRMMRSVRREIERKLDQLLTGTFRLYLLTDGSTSHFESDSVRIVELLKRSRKPLMLVSICDMAKRVAEYREIAPADHTAAEEQMQLF